LSHLAHPPIVERAVDLSHSGETTTREAIAFSKRPVCISHTDPNFFHANVRNKSDEVLRVLAESGSLLGFSLYRLHIGGPGCNLEAFTAMVARTAELMGLDHIGIASDPGPRLARFHARLDAQRVLDLRHSQASLARMAGLVSQSCRFRQPDGRLAGGRTLKQGRRPR